MRNFLLMRGSTLLWGFGVTYYFTGQLITAGKIFVVMAIGNTVLMYLFSTK